MTKSIDGFFNNLKTKKVAVIGLGVSHNDLITLLLSKEIAVTVLDKRSPEKIGADYEALKKIGAAFITGEDYLSHLTEFDIVFRTPGMYFNNEMITAARAKGVCITSELEVFFELCPCRIFAVTGSDGKTTTTTLIGEFFKAIGKTVHTGGNIGKPLLSRIEQINPEDICAAELSSFQLLSMRQSPDVAVITNISPNHLDVHGTMEEYIGAKKNILLHQNGFSRAVLNADNAETIALAPLVRGCLCTFSRKASVENGAYLDENNNIIRVVNGKTETIMNADDIRIPGIHNVENYLTAIAAVGAEIPAEVIKKVAHEFGGVEHRIEFVREVDGVKYYNDSIASSPTRTIAGLNSFKQKIIVIAGGYDKKIPYAPLGPVLCNRAKAVVLLGATAPKIEEAILNAPNYKESGITLFHAKTLEEAVALAKSFAESGDVVSLSPASASFDLYKNFEQRGKHFKNIVNSL